MLSSSAAKIFLKDKRKVVEGDGLKVFSTFAASEDCMDRILPGSIIAMNEIILEAGKRIGILPRTNTLIILFAVEGALGYEKEGGRPVQIKTGQAAFIESANEETVTIQNESADQVCRFFHISLQHDLLVDTNESQSLTLLTVDLTNPLIPLSNVDGHEETIYLWEDFLAGRRQITGFIRRVAQCLSLCYKGHLKYRTGYWRRMMDC